MQHPDEGTIHSWLDGALSADEAARVEAHVNECPECAAAVAEARGFIAGASRILTALDNAPRGVIPAAARKKRIDPWVLRVAATVLVVAAGTLVVVRDRGGNERSMSSAADTSTMSDQRVLTAGRVGAAAEPPQIAADAAMPKAAASDAPKPLRTKTGASGVGSRIAAPEKKEALERRSAMQAPRSLVPSGYAQAAASSDSATVAGGVASGFMARDERQSEPLKVVGTPQRIGAKITLYEVAPGDTVTLTEAVSLSLEAVVVTGFGVPTRTQAAPLSARSNGAQAKVRPDAAAIAKVSDSSRTASAPPPASPTVAPALTARAATVSTLHAITWTDSATKNTLTLTGRMPEARLQEIRIRIERERAAAAAAAAKKSP